MGRRLFSWTSAAHCWPEYISKIVLKRSRSKILRESKAQWLTVRQNSFDVKTGQTIDEKVDIWVGSYVAPSVIHYFTTVFFLVQSLGCTLFALAYSHSPFENTQTTEQGGSIAMAVLNAQYRHPQSVYSQGLKDLIDSMLKVNPAERPDINEVCNILPFFLSRCCLLIYGCS